MHYQKSSMQLEKYLKMQECGSGRSLLEFAFTGRRSLLLAQGMPPEGAQQLPCLALSLFIHCFHSNKNNRDFREQCVCVSMSYTGLSLSREKCVVAFYFVM